MRAKLSSLALALVLSTSTWAQADNENKDSVDTTIQEAEPSAKEEKKRKEKKSNFQWGGRVFFGNTLKRQELGDQVYWRNQLAVDSARFGFKYKHESGVRAVIKVEAKGSKVELRDAYIRIPLSADARIIAGQQKRPISEIALAGRWDLPLIERGLLTDLDLPFVGGRQQGIIFEYKLPVALKPRLSLSVFKSEEVLGIDPSQTLDASENFTQDFYVRASLEPVDSLVLSSSFAWVAYLRESSSLDSYKHGPLGSLELAYQHKRLHFWLEGFAGRNMSPVLDDATSGRFWAVRSIVAPRFKTGIPRRLVPYLGLSHYDPRISDSDDAASEGQVGVNLAFSKIWRLQIELSQVFAHGSSSSATEGTAFRIQLGAKFKE